LGASTERAKKNVGGHDGEVLEFHGVKYQQWLKIARGGGKSPGAPSKSKESGPLAVNGGRKVVRQGGEEVLTWGRGYKGRELVKKRIWEGGPTQGARAKKKGNGLRGKAGGGKGLPRKKGNSG